MMWRLLRLILWALLILAAATLGQAINRHLWIAAVIAGGALVTCVGLLLNPPERAK